jgi:hypothetical protein
VRGFTTSTAILDRRYDNGPVYEACESRDIRPYEGESGHDVRVTDSTRKVQLPTCFALLAVAVAVWNAAETHWVGVLVALTALAPTLLWWQMHHFLPHPRRRTALRPVLAFTAVALIALAVRIAS